MSTTQRSVHEGRGLGLGILIVSAGLLWFLFSINLVSASGINVALDLLPLGLIALGLDIALHLRSPRLSTLIVILIAVFVVAAAVIAPRLGIGVLETRTSSYTEPIADAEGASVNLYPSVGKIDLYALETQDTLFSAEATYLDEVTYTVSGTSQRQIEFGQREVHTTSWLGTDQDLRWSIGLTRSIPLNLSINTGVGEANLNLTDLNMTHLALTAGVGRIHLVLPNRETAYQVSITGGVGDLNIDIPILPTVDVTVDGGVGKVHIDIPDDAAIRVTVSSGLGNIHLPSSLERTTTGSDMQVWETADYASARHHITLYIQSGLGGLTIE